MTTTEAPRPSFWSRRVGVRLGNVERAAPAEHGVQPRRAGARRVRRRHRCSGAPSTPRSKLTNTEKFCTTCHEMRANVFEELKTTIHFTNRSGVRATCPDCHVPHEWTDKIARKMQASKEVWGQIFGTSTRARSFSTTGWSWRCTSGRGSRRTTRSNAATATAPSRWTSPGKARAPSAAHQRFLFTGEKTCIDCHKGIAHRLPDMRGVPGWQSEGAGAVSCGSGCTIAIAAHG